MTEAAVATGASGIMTTTGQLSTGSRRAAPVKFVRYAGVSVIATVVAQAGLAVAYGWLRWPLPAAVVLSLAVSALPALVLSRRYVWRGPGGGGTGQAGSFLAVAAAGSLATIVLVWLAVHVAQSATSDHSTLTLVANGASIVATGLIWVGRYFVLDRVVFRRVAS
jgi:putative flippase GtrA